MALSNWWIEMIRDGRKTNLKGGTGTGKDHGMDLHIRVRDEGVSVVVYKIQGFTQPDGTLRTEVWDQHGELVHTTYTTR